VEHLEDDDDNNNDSDDVEDISIHESWITRRYPRRQAISASATNRLHARECNRELPWSSGNASIRPPICADWPLLIREKYDAELMKYWLDRHGSRIGNGCRIHLAAWFADLGRKHEPDGL
jgi:hypothetical protein